MAVNCIDQGADMFRRRELADAVPQVENVGWTSGCGVGVRFAKAVQHPVHLGGDVLGRCKQNVGIDIALQGLARTAGLAADQLARRAQVHGPVQAKYLAVQVFHLGQPQTAAFGKHNARDDVAVMAALELR